MVEGRESGQAHLHSSAQYRTDVVNARHAMVLLTPVFPVPHITEDRANSKRSIIQLRPEKILFLVIHAQECLWVGLSIKMNGKASLALLKTTVQMPDIVYNYHTLISKSTPIKYT
jgi:hypothetical protein